MSEDDAQSLHQGYWRQHVHKESARNTGSPKGAVRDDQPDAREAGHCGVAERLVVPLKPGGGEGRGFGSGQTHDGEGLEIGRPINSGQRSETADGVARESEGRTRLPAASTPSTTRSAARTFWRMPMLSAAPTRARRAWTVRTSRPSRRTGSSDGWANWRLRSGRRLTDRINQTRFHTEGQRQAQAAGHLNLAGSGSA